MKAVKLNFKRLSKILLVAAIRPTQPLPEHIGSPLQARTKPKRTQDKATAASFVQKHGFMTNLESEDAFEARLGELREKRATDEQKSAEKEARTRELEGKRSRMIADPNYTFTGTIQSYKVANLEQIGDLVASLALPFVGLKKADIFNIITNHFETHPELKSLP